MMKTDLVSNLPSGMQERVNNTGSDMEKWLAERNISSDCSHLHFLYNLSRIHLEF